MSLSTVLYIMSVLHGVKFLALAIFIISILACLYYLTKAEKRRVVQSCAALLVSCMVMVTIPNTKGMMLLLAVHIAEHPAKTPEQQKIYDNLLKAIAESFN